MNKLDAEISKHREALNKLQAQKRKAVRPKVKSLRPKGRPAISDEKIKMAYELAKQFPIPDVARRLEISMSTLYAKGIKRYLINRKLANDNLSVKP